MRRVVDGTRTVTVTVLAAAGIAALRRSTLGYLDLEPSTSVIVSSHADPYTWPAVIAQWSKYRLQSYLNKLSITTLFIYNLFLSTYNLSGITFIYKSIITDSWLLIMPIATIHVVPYANSLGTDEIFYWQNKGKRMIEKYNVTLCFVKRRCLSLVVVIM